MNFITKILGLNPTQETQAIKKIVPVVSFTQVPEKFTDIREQWKTLANSKLITKEDMAALSLYISLIKDEDATQLTERLRRTFKSVSNPIKLSNGFAPYGQAREALNTIKYSTVAKWLTVEEINILISLSRLIGDLDV